MALNISLLCPHCGTENAGFSCSNYLSIPNRQYIFLLFLQCRVCFEGVIAKIETGGVEALVRNGHGVTFRIHEVYPEPKPSNAPDHVPQNIARFFVQGFDNLNRGNWDAAGTMFRKTLDVALKAIHPDGRGTLERRIDALPPDLGVTPAMKAWVHEIRRLGNDAAHEEEPFTEQEAKALKAFTDLFLIYTFSLPGMLSARQAETKPASS